MLCNYVLKEVIVICILYRSFHSPFLFRGIYYSHSRLRATKKINYYFGLLITWHCCIRLFRKQTCLRAVISLSFQSSHWVPKKSVGNLVEIVDYFPHYFIHRNLEDNSRSTSFSRLFLPATLQAKTIAIARINASPTSKTGDT